MEKEIVNTVLGDVKIIRQIGRGKSGYSYLATLNNEPVVFKRMHDEPCAYYTFSDTKVRLEVDAYARLNALGVTIPALLGYDIEQQYLIKEFIDGPCGHEWQVDAGSADEGAIVAQLFSISNLLQTHGFNIDYFPANFVIAQQKLYYVDYETNAFSDEWGLAQWGIYYWANRAGMAAHARTGDWRNINASADSGKPITLPFEAQVSAWREEYGLR